MTTVCVVVVIQDGGAPQETQPRDFNAGCRQCHPRCWNRALCVDNKLSAHRGRIDEAGPAKRDELFTPCKKMDSGNKGQCSKLESVD